jgi:heat shock protein HslJ
MIHKILKSKYFHTISLLLLISISVGACGNTSSIETITDITWQWTELVETEPASQSLVPESENYTLFLSPDGSLSIKADCNMVNGSYTLDGSSLTIELGPSTMAFCGEQSSDLQYLDLLGSVESHSVVAGQLVLELIEGAGRMTFNEE